MARFEDDKPVRLDCEHTAYPEDDYFELTIPLTDKSGKITYHHATYCGECECFENVVSGWLDRVRLHVDSATDKEYEYGDIKYKEGDY